MSVRDTIRSFRLYYKSAGLFKRAFRNYLWAWSFPFFGPNRFLPRTGSNPVVMPRKYWTMLPTAARLVLVGANPRWDDAHLRVSYEGLELVSPPFGKMIGQSLKEIYVDDVYRIKNSDLTGKIVVDIGSYIGDSSVAFALRGATVHAFEPQAKCQPYLRDNITLNHLVGKVHPHAVGLSNKDEIIPASTNGGDEDPLVLVDVLRYFRAHHIGRVDILKLDCEGCEYELFEHGCFLAQLKPQQIIMEYHRGGRDLYKLLRGHGYSVQWPERDDLVGYMYARLDGAPCEQ